MAARDHVSRVALGIIVAVLVLLVGVARWGSDRSTQDAGGALMPEQAAYDVTFYDLALTIDPEGRQIAGSLTAHADLHERLSVFVLDLDDRLTVEQAEVWTGRRFEGAAFSHDANRVRISLPRRAVRDRRARVRVTYAGAPREAPNPPWDGGFTWARTADHHPWIATSCQTLGADLWWPVKDHPSDEPDSMALRFTVPKPLVAASNGTLRNVRDEGTARTYEWFVSTPINSYTVALNVAPYDTLQVPYTSTSGEAMPLTFWVLPEDAGRARRALPGFIDQLRFLEETFGPYPFQQDKFGIAQTPFLGMEHQTLIAYGHDFTSGGLGYDVGFDALFLHEMAHEWFGNLVTSPDWKDFWLHEGFATYVEVLYAEHRYGERGYRAVMAHVRDNARPGQIARRQPTSALEMYGSNVYYKGALVLDALRTEVGDAVFFKVLRRMTGVAGAHDQVAAARFLTTDQFVALVQAEAGRPLDAFFDRYVYGSELPASPATAAR